MENSFHITLFLYLHFVLYSSVIIRRNTHISFVAQDLLNGAVDLSGEYSRFVRQYELECKIDRRTRRTECIKIKNQRSRAMEIIQKEDCGITCLKIEGRMDTAVAIETENAVDKLLKGNNKRLLFDLTDLEYLSSYGLRIILNAVKKIKMMGGKIILCSLVENIKEIFDICGFSANIPIADSVESGIKVLS